MHGAYDQRISELTEAVNILSGQVAALIAYVAQLSPQFDPDSIRQMQGLAQQLAPKGLLSRTSPGLSASQGVEKIASLAGQRPIQQQP